MNSKGYCGVKLELNPDKIEALLVGGSLDQMGGKSPALDRVTLPLKEQVRSLGGTAGSFAVT